MAVAASASAPPGFGNYQDPSTGIPKVGRTPGGGTYIIPGSYTKPPGGEYNPVAQTWERTPASAGQRAGQFTQSYLDTVPSLQGLVGGGGGGGGTGGGGGGTGGTTSTGSDGSALPMPTPPDASSATRAAFAQAKDTAGQLARSSLTSLAGELGSQGMLGGGAQAGATRDIIGQSVNAEGAASRAEAQKTADIASQYGLAGYQGDVTMRGQDIQKQEADATLELARSNAVRQQQMQMLQLALTGLKPGGTPSGIAY